MVQKQVSHQIGATSFDTRRHICLAPSRILNKYKYKYKYKSNTNTCEGKQLDLIKCVYSLGFIHKSGLSPWHQP